MRLRNMLKTCLVFWKSEPQYAYKPYGYKKTCIFYSEPRRSLLRPSALSSVLADSVESDSAVSVQRDSAVSVQHDSAVSVQREGIQMESFRMKTTSKRLQRDSRDSMEDRSSIFTGKNFLWCLECSTPFTVNRDVYFYSVWCFED